MKNRIKEFLPLIAGLVIGIILFKRKGMKSGYLSPNLKIEQGYKSSTATRLNINNEPTPAIIERMRAVAANIYEPLFKKVEGLNITSFYRSPALNKAVQGSAVSQHMKGEAIDLTSKDTRKLFEEAKRLPSFDQIIYEYGNDTAPAWVHISISKNNRRQILRATKNASGQTIYTPFK